MNTIKHILVPTDLSAEAQRPLDFVFEFARKSGATIHFLNVISETIGFPSSIPMAPPATHEQIREYVAAAEKELERWYAKLPKDLPLKTQVIVDPDIPHAILTYAEEHEIDMIAISTHGRTGMRRWAMGSVAELVVRHSPIPVLTFPRKAK